MRIATLTPWLSRRGGGIPNAVLPLLHELSLRGNEVVAYGFDAPNEPLDGVQVEVRRPIAPRTFSLRGAAPGTSLDIVHTHGLWSTLSVAALRWRRRTGRPTVVSPHGMLDPWALEQSAMKKRIALRLFEHEHIAQASCVHALNPAEADAIRAVAPTATVAVIPNGVSLPRPAAPACSCTSPRTLLFLGRLHHKKGLEPLLHAWSRFRQSAPTVAGDWRLEVRGWGEQRYVDALLALRGELGLENSVDIPGPVFGEERDTAYRCASAVILPSYSEGLPMAVLEAWSYRRPVLMTAACNLPEGFDQGAAFEIHTDPDVLARELADRLANIEILTAAGAAGLSLVQRRFSWRSIAEQWDGVYAWTRGEGDRPACLLSPGEPLRRAA